MSIVLRRPEAEGGWTHPGHGGAVPGTRYVATVTPDPAGGPIEVSGSSTLFI
jgi:hypothetical protein